MVHTVPVVFFRKKTHPFPVPRNHRSIRSEELQTCSIAAIQRSSNSFYLSPKFLIQPVRPPPESNKVIIRMNLFFSQ